MNGAQSTCWTMIRGAAERQDDSLREFGRRYAPILAAYFAARWRVARDTESVQDAVQECFVQILREGGGLDRFQPDREGGFRPFLYGLARNLALQIEDRERRERSRRRHDSINLDEQAADDATLSQVFDQAWAKEMMREARALLQERADGGCERTQRAVDLLRRRFELGEQIKDIALEENADARALYREMDRARELFRLTLNEVLTFHHPGAPREAETEAQRLLQALS